MKEKRDWVEVPWCLIKDEEINGNQFKVLLAFIRQESYSNFKFGNRRIMFNCEWFSKMLGMENSDMLMSVGWLVKHKYLINIENNTYVLNWEKIGVVTKEEEKSKEEPQPAYTPQEYAARFFNKNPDDIY